MFLKSTKLWSALGDVLPQQIVIWNLARISDYALKVSHEEQCRQYVEDDCLPGRDLFKLLRRNVRVHRARRTVTAVVIVMHDNYWRHRIVNQRVP